MPRTLTRRNFLDLLNPSFGTTPGSLSKHRSEPLSDPLAAFVPDANNPWNEYLAGHLLRRTMMAPVWSDIEALVALGDPGKAVDLLFGATSDPAAPGAANDQVEDPGTISNQTLKGQILGQIAGDASALRTWWMNLQIQATNSIQEKMVAFWSGHFTTQFDLGNEDYVIAPLLYRQNELFRQNGLGNFKQLVKDVTLDGAMLVFLGGTQNTAGAPNENYARELMELFTCGLGGGYTEADVQAGARILTGWRVSQYKYQEDPNGMFEVYFDPTQHDTGDKTYLQADFPAISTAQNTAELVEQNEIDKMIDTLFAYTATAIASFICTKLYKFFVYSDPDTSDSTEQQVISEMADMFKQDWEIQPVVSALLKSQHFFDNVNIGAQIKTPAEYAIGLARNFSMASGSVDGAMTTDNEQFFQPPNVSGWPGYHDWLTTNTYPSRGTQAQAAVSAMSSQDLESFYQQFPAYNTDVTKLATQIGQLLLPRSLSSTRLQNFWQTLAGTTQESAWINLVNTDPEEAAKNVQSLLNYIIALPDFELC